MSCQASAQRRCDGLRAAFGNWPADGVSGGGQHHAKGGTQRFVEAEEGVCGETGEERFGAIAAEFSSGDGVGGAKSAESKASHQKWMRGKKAQRAQDFNGECRPLFG